MEAFKIKLCDDYKKVRRDIESLEKTLEWASKTNAFSPSEIALKRKRCDAMVEYQKCLYEELEHYGIEHHPYLYQHDDEKDANLYDYRKIMRMAIDDCMREMYSHAQPAADYDEYIRMLNEGETPDAPHSSKRLGLEKDNMICDRHYLSTEDYGHIVECIIKKYNLRSYWKEHLDIVIEYLNGDVPTNSKDENGMYKRLPDFKDVVLDIINSSAPQTETGDIPLKIKEAVINRITECQRFYNFNRVERNFMWAVALELPSPTSNKDTVIEYWKRQGKDIVIIDRDFDKYWDDYFYQDQTFLDMDDE